MKKFLILSFCSFALCFAAQVGADNRRFIEITGTSETEVSPDELYISVTLMERMEGKDKIGIEKQESDLKKAIKDIGLDIGSLTLNTANADYRSIRKKNKDVLISKNYTVKLSNTDQLSKLYDKLDQMNAYDAYISKYANSKIQNVEKENRIKAVKIAKEKADYLLAALGQQAGAPIQILELENFVQEVSENFGVKMLSANARFMSERDVMGAAPEAETISFRKIKVKSSYQVKYEIINK